MCILNEFVEKKEVKKIRPRARPANQAHEYLQFVNFEPNH